MTTVGNAMQPCKRQLIYRRATVCVSLDSTVEIAPVPASNISDSFQQQVWRIYMESWVGAGMRFGVDD
jgi:hypothetical protein